MPARYLIDASNLHAGGSAQVAASIVNELSVLVDSTQNQLTSTEWQAVVSSEVSANILKTTWVSGLSIVVADSRPGRWARMPSAGYDAALTVFGPNYRRRCASREIVGFALPRLIYDLDDVGLPTASRKERLLNEIRWHRFRSADVLVTETDDAALQLGSRLPKNRIEVIPNCVSGSVTDRSLWELSPRVASLDSDMVLLASVARYYPHKNLEFLPLLGAALEDQLDRKVRFVVTLSDEEYSSMSHEFRKATLNCGVLRQVELGFLYERCIATVFPSLLEVSSVTPLESLFLGCPVFASDLPSMRSSLGEVADYFDPWNANRAASQIASKLGREYLEQRSREALVWSQSQGTARDRARRYSDLLTQR